MVYWAVARRGRDRAGCVRREAGDTTLQVGPTPLAGARTAGDTRDGRSASFTHPGLPGRRRRHPAARGGDAVGGDPGVRAPVRGGDPEGRAGPHVWSGAFP